MRKIIGISLIVITGMLFSCQNEKVNLSQDEASFEKSAQITLTEAQLDAVATASEYEVEFYANAEEALTHRWKMGMKWRWTNKLRYLANHCPGVVITQGDNNGYPKVITLNYGEGTELKNDKVLSGIIVIEISGPRNSASYTRMVTYNNFKIDTIQISGTSMIKINKQNETFRNYTSDLTFTINGNKVVTRSSKRAWTWIEGMETTDNQTDDVIHIEGFVTATSGADSYKKEIVKPLVRLGDCRFIVSGAVTVTLNGEMVSTLDYGNGSCDEAATMKTSDGTVTEVDLAKYKLKGKKFRKN